MGQAVRSVVNHFNIMAACVVCRLHRTAVWANKRDQPRFVGDVLQEGRSVKDRPFIAMNFLINTANQVAAKTCSNFGVIIDTLTLDPELEALCNNCPIDFNKPDQLLAT